MFQMMKESQKLPLHVKVWMGAMVLTFGSHFFFLDSPPHVISLVAFFVTLAVFAPLSFNATGNINALAACHFIAWPVALTLGLREVFLSGLPQFDLAGAVLLAGYGVFLVSLLLDYRILMSELRRDPRTGSNPSHIMQTEEAT